MPATPLKIGGQSIARPDLNFDQCGYRLSHTNGVEYLVNIPSEVSEGEIGK